MVLQGSRSVVAAIVSGRTLAGGDSTRFHRYNGRMVLEPDAFRRLCRAREMLCATDERAPSVREVARATGIQLYQPGSPEPGQRP
jgi:hypothetical protein